jgi:hypothetical protein
MSDVIVCLFPLGQNAHGDAKNRTPSDLRDGNRKEHSVQKKYKPGDGSLPLAYETAFSIFRDESCDLSLRNRSYDALPPDDFRDLSPHLR